MFNIKASIRWHTSAIIALASSRLSLICTTEFINIYLFYFYFAAQLWTEAWLPV